jgi:hypothetical protein
VHRPLADSEESAFLDCFDGAVVGAGTAADADIGIDDVLVLAFGDGLDGAVVGAGAALDASVSDIVSHDFPSMYVFISVRELTYLYSSMDF